MIYIYSSLEPDQALLVGYGSRYFAMGHVGTRVENVDCLSLYCVWLMFC